jgi:hypothetical protein
MNRWLETHVYIAEWICAVFGVLAGSAFIAAVVNAAKRIATSHLPTARAFAAKCGAYAAAGCVLVVVRLPGNREAAKELTKYAVTALILWVVCEAMKQPAPQQNWPDC